MACGRKLKWETWNSELYAVDIKRHSRPSLKAIKQTKRDMSFHQLLTPCSAMLSVAFPLHYSSGRLIG